MQLDQKNNELRNVVRTHPYFKSLVNRKNSGWARGLDSNSCPHSTTDYLSDPEPPLFSVLEYSCAFFPNFSMPNRTMSAKP